MQSFRQYLSALNIILASLAIGVAMFFAVVLLVNWGTWTFHDEQNLNFVIVVAVVAVGGFTAAIMIGNRLTEKASRQVSVREKLNQFRTAMITRAALIEGPSLFALVFGLITHNWIYLPVAAIGLALLSNSFVSSGNLIDRLQFSRDQREEIERPEFRL